MKLTAQSLIPFNDSALYTPRLNNTLSMPKFAIPIMHTPVSVKFVRPRPVSAQVIHPCITRRESRGSGHFRMEISGRNRTTRHCNPPGYDKRADGHFLLAPHLVTRGNRLVENSFQRPLEAKVSIRVSLLPKMNLRWWYYYCIAWGYVEKKVLLYEWANS